MAVTKTKSVGFYQVLVNANGTLERPVIDWRAVLRRVGAKDVPDRTHDGVVYDPHVTDSAALLGVHALIKPDFMSHIGANGSITDLMDKAEGAGVEQLANSTAVSFLDVGNAVAVATGTTHSPKPPRVVVDFLERHHPLPEGRHWTAQPIMDTAKIKQFRDQTNGAARFESRITTVRDLFQPEASTGIVKFADQLADRIGGDVIVDLVVRLAPGSQSRSIKQRFRDLVLGDLPRIGANPQSRSKVTALFENGAEEELNLVAARLADTIEVDPDVSESLRFSALLEHLDDVGARMKDRVRELLEG